MGQTGKSKFQRKTELSREIPHDGSVRDKRSRDGKMESYGQIMKTRGGIHTHLMPSG